MVDKEMLRKPSGDPGGHPVNLLVNLLCCQFAVQTNPLGIGDALAVAPQVCRMEGTCPAMRQNRLLHERLQHRLCRTHDVISASTGAC